MATGTRTAAGTQDGDSTAASAPRTAPATRLMSAPTLRCHSGGSWRRASAPSTPVSVLVMYVLDIRPRRRTATLCMPIAAAPSTRACPVDHGTGLRSQMLIEATSMVPW